MDIKRQFTIEEEIISVPVPAATTPRRVPPPTPAYTPVVPEPKKGVIIRSAPMERDGRNYKIVQVDTNAYLVPSEEVSGSRGQEVTVSIAKDAVMCYDLSDEIRSLSIPTDVAERMQQSFWRGGGVTRDDVIWDGIQQTILVPPSTSKQVKGDS